MKTVIFDMNGLGIQGADQFIVRPFFATLIEYLAINKVHVYIAMPRPQAIPHELRGFVSGSYPKSSPPPRQPNLVVTADEKYGSDLSCLVIPPYTDGFNKFASLSLAGMLLDKLRDRVVLGKQAAEIEKIEKPKKEDDDKPDEDVTNYSFAL